MMLVWCVLTLLALVPVSTATSPGVKVKLTQKGLEYGRQLGIATLQQRFSTISLPDQSGTEKVVIGKVEYSVTGIRIVNLGLPTSTVELVSGTGVRLSIDNANIKAQGNWRVRYLRFIKASGSFDLTVSGVTISVTIAVNNDNRGRPSVSMTSCTADVRDVDVRFSGRLSWLYNLFRSFIERPIRNSLQAQICPLVAKSIPDINTELATLNVVAKVDKYVEIDYSMLGSALLSSESIDLGLKGVFYNIGQRNEPPFSPKPFSLPSQNTKMLYIGLSAFTVNSAAFAYHNAGAFSFDITDDLIGGFISPDSDFRLNTETFEASFPQVAKLYPGLKMRLLVKTVKEPIITFEPNNVTVQVSSTVTAYVIHQNNTLSPLFVLSLEASASAKVNIAGLNLIASVTLNRIHLSLDKSYVGNIEVASPQESSEFDNLLKTILEFTVIPKVNARLLNGVPLPAMGKIKLVNPQLVVVKDYLLIGTDGQFLG
ncbi:bactericidal permeability-increasing protein-like [Triplophysa rosa]|uniref:Bactericidal permeability-increasing protein n=1 Tax=Triplophysa rosa TaxID=992332 RepID=A0A9W7TF56_TRIRA|nr:bactericidal permeability-increasing protein-like [Triplophysa rosa]KAI7795323.1 bactericidal permeability-increasing protein/lipopolysaccharide-binding protein [Triplophysa rosa]